MLIPETSVLKDELMGGNSIKFLIDHCVTTICKRIGSFVDISSRSSFCWGVVASCCSRIPISDTFEWVHLFPFVIDQLGRVYGMYCEFHNLNEKGFVLVDNKLPDDIKESSCEEVKQVFCWLCRAQSLLAKWTQKFASERVNYDELELYRTNFSSISRVSSLFYASDKMTDIHQVAAVQTDFNQNFELLNIFLIRYVKEKIELGWYVQYVHLFYFASSCMYNVCIHEPDFCTPLAKMCFKWHNSDVNFQSYKTATVVISQCSTYFYIQ